jgi:hypothetical protein
MLNTQGKGPYLNALEKFTYTKQRKQASCLTTTMLTPIILSLNYYPNINSNTTVGNGSVYNLHPQHNLSRIQDRAKSNKNRTHI